MTIRDHPQVKEFKKAAERYCALLQSDAGNPERWVEKVLAALASLYAAGHILPDLGLSDDAPDIPDSLDVTTNEWRSVFGRVQKALGTQEAYWAYFDPGGPADADEEPICHSLADDLADVYRDVMPGLRAWSAQDDRYLETIVFDWKTLFGSHWGLHAVSAMRALHPIAFLRGLSTNAEPSVAPNGGPATQFGNPGVTEGPPSVS
jgi:Domain of unknown function (DUF5063)